MIKRLCTLLVLVAVGGALVAGLRKQQQQLIRRTSSSSSAPAGTATSASSTASAGGSTGGGSVASNPAVQAAVAQCKASINAASTLSADAKTKLDGLCDEAAKGDPASLKKASAEVCQEIVKETVPSSAQDAALAACPKP